MRNPQVIIFPLVVLAAALTSCSQFSKSGDTTMASGSRVGFLSGAPAPDTGSVAGSNDQAMDGLDKSKLSHALDGGIGKATTWSNVSTGMQYTVVPTEKLSIGSNPFCRRYTITSVRKGSARTMNGTACVSSDGAWHPA